MSTKPILPTDAAAATVRVYAQEAAAATVPPRSGNDDELDYMLHGMIEWRKTQRDLAQLASDPTRLAGYDKLPATVQALAKTDPMSFWMLWQAAQAGVDLHVIDAFQQALQRELDTALLNDGWDGSSAPTDEQLDRASKTVRRMLTD